MSLGGAGLGGGSGGGGGGGASGGLGGGSGSGGGGPPGMVFGGDEIGALVLDPGHRSLRLGYAQDDSPKCELPACVGVAPEQAGREGSNVTQPPPTTNQTLVPPQQQQQQAQPPQNPQQGQAATPTPAAPPPPPQYRYFVDTTVLNVPRPGMEVVSYMKDGTIDNWDLFEKVLDYAYDRVIKSSSDYHPTLFSETPWAPRASREKLAEIMFEKYSVPAFFLVKNAVLAAFANGKSTALVVDSGAVHTSAVPVLDGYALTAAAVRSSLGGDHLANQARALLNSIGAPLVPATFVQSKEAVRDKEKARFALKKFPEGLTHSWREYMTRQVLDDFAQTVAQVSESPYEERVAASIPAVHYELPCGYHQDFGPERFRLAETLFEHQMLGASQLVQTAVSMCDIDMRPAMWGSVVVTGGGTLANGWAERLTRDLTTRTPSSVRLKTIAANGSAERRFGAWIGGSILASIGSFQQMWISSQEYEEAGKGQVERKCP